jgi:hypothetical protein
MAKNAFLKKLQAQSEEKAKQTGDITERWTRQAALDAAILTLAYGKCMGNDRWGAKRLESFGDEFVENLLYVTKGASYQPDADSVRADVDKLLKAKLHPDRFGPWAFRYAFWVEDPLEVEAQKKRGEWIREGVNLKDDGGTSKLLRGIADETK